MEPALILFDLDGTLVDSAPDIARALNATMAELGAPALPVPQVIGYVGDGAAKLVERATGTQPADPVLVETFRRHYAAAVCVETRLYDGMLEVLRACAAAGIRTAVLTNKPGDLARALLRALDLGSFFGDDVIGDGDGWARKPAPDAALALLARHGAAPAGALMVGDGVPDMRLARAAGCRAVAAAWGYTARDVLAAERPDAVVEEPLDLLSLLGLPAPGAA